MELGLYSFGDSSIEPGTGKYMPENLIFKNLLERIKLADEVGLNYFGLGEHHREDYPVSAPAILLAAAATQTEQIHLGSAVTVLPTKDPVRVFQQFSTLDQITEGRAELTVGTGAYIESYPLFGHELADAQANFTEKLGLLRQLNDKNPVTFEGEFRAPLHESGIWPRPFNEKLNIWVATGETPESSERAASFGFNANYSFLSAPPASKQAVIEHYRAVAANHGHTTCIGQGLHQPGGLCTEPARRSARPLGTAQKQWRIHDPLRVAPGQVWSVGILFLHRHPRPHQPAACGRSAARAARLVCVLQSLGFLPRL